MTQGVIETQHADSGLIVIAVFSLLFFSKICDFADISTKSYKLRFAGVSIK